VFGLCTILSKKREGATFVVHVECKSPSGYAIAALRPQRRPSGSPSRNFRLCARGGLDAGR
jgi:hypothetical protein